jgi:hypothetical protein
MVGLLGFVLAILTLPFKSRLRLDAENAGAPVSREVWVIGLFLGIDLIFYGLAWIALALGLRSM